MLPMQTWRMFIRVPIKTLDRSPPDLLYPHDVSLFIRCRWTQGDGDIYKPLWIVSERPLCTLLLLGVRRAVVAYSRALSVRLPAWLRLWSDVLSPHSWLCVHVSPGPTGEAPQYWPVSMATACLSERPACRPQDHCELLGVGRLPASGASAASCAHGANKPGEGRFDNNQQNLPDQ